MRNILALLLLTTPFLNGFVLLSGPREAKLDVSRDNPTAEFVLSDDLPAISGKSDFLGGRYADLDDDAFWVALVTETMAVWNEVTDSYVELTVTTGASANADSGDQINSIVSGSTSASAAAFAKPEIDGDTIKDCDITIGKSTRKATSLAYTLLHELGHCLGLGHNHSNYDAVMSYSRSSRQLRLGLDDRVGLVYLYPGANVEAAKETWGCAVVGARQPASTWLIVLAPLAILLFRRRRLEGRS